MGYCKLTYGGFAMDLLQRAETQAIEESKNISNRFEQAYKATVATLPEADYAAAEMKGVKDYLKRLDTLRKELVTPLNDHIKKINGLFAPPRELGEKTVKLLGDKLVAFHTDQENKRRLQEAKDREAADRERAKLEQQALRLAEKGKTDQAVAKRQEAEALPTPVAAPVEKPKGYSEREDWQYEVLNECEIPSEYWVVDHQALAKVVRAMKGTKEIPGIRQFHKPIPVSR